MLAERDGEPATEHGLGPSDVSCPVTHRCCRFGVAPEFLPLHSGGGRAYWPRQPKRPPAARRRQRRALTRRGESPCLFAIVVRPQVRFGQRRGLPRKREGERPKSLTVSWTTNQCSAGTWIGGPPSNFGCSPRCWSRRSSTATSTATRPAAPSVCSGNRSRRVRTFSPSRLRAARRRGKSRRGRMRWRHRPPTPAAGDVDARGPADLGRTRLASAGRQPRRSEVVGGAGENRRVEVC